MPKARDAIVSMFPGIPVDSRTNPEESVASGAAIAARLFSPAGGEGDAAAAAGAGAPNKGKGKKGGGKGKETSAEASVSTSGPVNMLGETQVATVHCPASIGIATEDGRLGVVIHRLALLPTSGSITLPLPAVDGVVTVTVYQGEEFETATANRGLVSLPLRSPVPSAATVEMKVTVVALATGALHIRAAVVGGEGSGVEVKLGPGVDAPPLAYEQESDLAQVLTFEPPAVAAVAEMNEKEAPKVEPPPMPAVATPVPAPKVAAPAPAAVKPASVPLVSADDLD